MTRHNTSKMTESIPINIARALLPNRMDYVKLSHIYTPLRADQQLESQLKYVLPQSANITWTHLCPNWKGFGEPYYEIIYENSEDGTCITLPIISCSIESGYYEPFTWPIPPIRLRENTTLTLYVSLPSSPPAPPMPQPIPFSLKVLGFEDILPESAPQYILDDSSPSAWSFIKDDSTQMYSLLTPIQLNSTASVHPHSVTIPKSSDLILAGIP
jgi:hypothetical protein